MLVPETKDTTFNT